MSSTKFSSINPDFQLKKTEQISVDEFAARIQRGGRTALSRAITLIESSNPEIHATGRQILHKLMPFTGNSVRVAITGVPGAGKSTFIDAFGDYLITKNKNVAVLTVDPSSSVSGGSILGDKTRMPVLAANKKAYIRPSPASGSLGGVARKTRETILLCEAAGFDIIFVETVGVGQSEIAVKNMTDFFLLLMLPGAGDELQGIKRGIMEMADLIAVNKSDGDHKQAAARAVRGYKNALALLPKHPAGWDVPVAACSAVEKTGLQEIRSNMETYVKQTKTSGFFEKNRKKQSLYWLHEEILEQMKRKIFGNAAIQQKLRAMEKKVEEGSITPFEAAAELIQSIQVT